MKLLLDTNVLIDLLSPRSPYDSDIRKLCIASSFGDVQLWVSVQSFADAYYVLCRRASREAVKKALLSSLEFFIPCGTYASDLKPALASDWNDIEDYLIAYSSRHIEASYLITRDIELIQKSPIPAMPASEFLGLLERKFGLTYEDIGL